MISLLVVNYRSAALAAEAIRTARASTGESLQVVVVDNSEEAAALELPADRILVSRTNRGYGGGINDGRRECTGDVLIVANPDVTFAPGAIDGLANAVRDGAAVAGPALFWDDAHTWLLPPADLRTGAEKIDEILAARSAKWARERDRRRICARLKFWSLSQTTPVRALSGAVMAIGAADFDAIGGFDERFPLYFEENDFLRRAAAARKRIVYVPAARCRHLYNQSAAQVSAEAARRYAESERRYFAKWNGPFVAHLFARLARPLPPAPLTAGSMELDRDGLLVEASPLPSFDTAAGHFPRTRRIELPPEVKATYRGDALYLRTVDPATGDVLATLKCAP